MRSKALLIVFVLCLSSLLQAQDFDRYLLSQRDISGTARYVAMGGAFAALGGDVSAIIDNPAALGVFRHGELSLTIDYQYTASHSSATMPYTNVLRLPQFSCVFGWGKEDKQVGLLRSNFAVQYHRVRSYNRSYATSSVQPFSQTDLIAELTKDVDPLSLNAGNDVWDDVSIGWLSVMGYDCGVIVPDTVNIGTWYSVLTENENVQANTQVKETGSADEYTFSYGANIANRFYWGLSVNLFTLKHNKTVSYSEAFKQGGGYSYVTSVSATAVGGSASIGFLYRPVTSFRMGAALFTPTTTYLRISNTVDYGDVSSPQNTLSFDKYYLPARLTAGVAWQFTTKGLLSLEYDWRCPVKNVLPAEHTLKIGGEYVVKNNWFFRMGYSYKSAFAKTDFYFMPGTTDTRTDTEFFNPKGVHYAGLGLGFRNQRWYCDLAYQYRMEKMDFYAHCYQSTPDVLQLSSHRIILTIGLTR